MLQIRHFIVDAFIIVVTNVHAIKELKYVLCNCSVSIVFFLSYSVVKIY